MMRAWVGVALLGVSWLLGTTYYFPAHRLAWVAVVAAGAVLLSGIMRRGPRRRDAWIALVLLLPAVCIAPWPLRAAPLLIVVGLALDLLPIPRRWPGRLGPAAVAAGVVMLAQAVSMAAYAAWTARCHDLPRPLPQGLAGVARLLGVDAAADGSAVVLHSIRQVHRLGATWELLLDPPTLCFLIGGLVMLALAAWGDSRSGRSGANAGPAPPWAGSAWLRAAGALALVVVLWLPFRAGLLIALYLHRVLRWDPELPLHVMNQFLSPWVHLLILVGPVLLAWRLVRVPTGPELQAPGQRGQAPDAETNSWYYPAAAGLVLMAAVIFTVAAEWDPVGTRQAGRVTVVERHSTWEPTTKPYDTQWFGHDSGYNYAAIYRYLTQFFDMSRLLPSDTIDHATLAGCDVLVIKTPTERYSREEVDAVVRFVRRGGGLLLVGDHTNVFNSGTYLNDIARRFGFALRHDLLFGTGESPYDQLYQRPRTPHPVVGHLPPTNFAVSCSIDPGRSWGRPVIQETGLWSLPPNYHVENYHPFPQHRPEMRYGAFIQLWSTRHGTGRVLAFGDSTIFSNFCTFQPGKAELMRDMIEWLGHRNPGDPGPWLLPLGFVPLLSGLWLARARQKAVRNGAAGASAAATDRASGAAGGGVGLVLLSAGTCGWALASVAVVLIGRSSMPAPEPKPGRSLPCAVIDRTTSEVPLCEGPDVQGSGEGYGMFEQWIPRLGWYTRRATGPDALGGDALVVFCPSRSVSPEFRRQLVRYVAEGGKLLVVDSPENTASTANSLLWPFGLSVHHDQPARGVLTVADDWPGIEIPPACTLSGGRSIARVGKTAVGAVARYGEGTAMAIGFGSLLNDRGMGYGGPESGRAVWTVQPTANMLFTYDTYVRYAVEFALLRALMAGQPVEAFYSGHVVIDRTLSQAILPQPGAIPEEQEGFGLAEMWFDYLGYSTARGSGTEAVSGDALVIFYPSRPLSREFRARVARYVDDGGKLLVIDSPENEGSTAGELLKPFGLAVDQATPRQGTLEIRNADGTLWAELPIGAAWSVGGGEPFAALDPQTPIGATARFGNGAVTVVGFGSLFDNSTMRGSWDLPPPARSLLPYDVLTAVVRSLMTDEPFAKCLPSRSD